MFAILNLMQYSNSPLEVTGEARFAASKESQALP